MVFASLPLHAFFGVVLMGTRKVLGADYYRSLGLSWHTDLLGDQRLGGGIAWAAGELPLVIVMLALLVQWARSDDRTARRLDRAAERDDDAELVAYNAMLAELAGRDTPKRFSPARGLVHSRDSFHRSGGHCRIRGRSPAGPSVAPSSMAARTGGAAFTAQ